MFVSKEIPQSESLTYDELTGNPDQIFDLLEGCCVSSSDITPAEALLFWENGRSFIAEAIHKDGTLLDYGCANGFLIKSLQKWSPHILIPYGVDVEIDAVEQAKRLFSDCPEHFAMLDDTTVVDSNFPPLFDLVYWNVWDVFALNDQRGNANFQSLKNKVARNGRLILGFYDTYDANRRKIEEQLIGNGNRPDEVIENPDGEEVIVYFDV